ncbi:Outer membrane receptor proteins, mostly Fe transport [Filimonas lacunae]|uniref:Outer membrane receptor proteins, mostly Fe transport n=1 Tax=Filimonas lacunae TaxID=477680 RepID=A0A173MHU6_9BACT|nr:TonB-dependent receptor [Filimonas lacunae]BAV07069.1 sucrose-specific TonB-dependent receptor [Filimonas lacunae]SIS95426.1 Outer membrane receptor proteins, mostly Fe transport [Filimonas lacunae]
MKTSFSILAFLLYALSLAAQEPQKISGHVLSYKNEPLSGATVWVTPGNKVVTTDSTGVFTVTVPAGKSVTIKVSFTGYETTEQTLNEASVNKPLLFVLKSDVLALSDVIVVGNTSPRSKLNSSISVSTLRPDDVQKAAPRTTAEIFRSIPGIRAEASGGDGNTNITVRGVPISSGGSKYLQLQEDGLPVLQFGDIAFATADIFLRADATIGRIEAIRGGSASTLATNSPAGIINFISKTGAVEGGGVAVSSGLDYGNFRTDFNYGAPIGNGVSYFVGGFYRVGQGPRTAGFAANNGGQLKFNINKQFSNGYVRLYAKYLNDRAAAYMPMPLQVTGTNSDPVYSNVPGFDAKKGALQSAYLLQDMGTGVNGELRRADVSDGMHPVSKTIGVELAFDLDNNWRIENRGRLAMNNGRFIAPFPAQVGSTASVLSTIAGATGWNLANARLSYANDGSAYTGSNAMLIHMFDVELNNMNNFVNDFKLKKKVEAGDITFGFFKSYQNVGMSWLWSSFLTDVNGNGLRPLLVTNSTGTVMNPGGQLQYGTPVWGNLRRNYDTRYDISAPYVAAALNVTRKLNIDASVRWDIGNVRGSYTGGSTAAKDMNGDGVISANEQKVESIDYNTTKPVKYNYNYGSYSIGANYKLDASKAIFARYSSGAVTKADRILFTSNVMADGSVRGFKDNIDQAELGFKSNYKAVGLFITGFYARVNEQGGFEATTQKVIENHYRSYGVELEAAARISRHFDIRGGATFTKAELTDGANKGNRPRRQSPFIYNLVPTYTAGRLSAGVTAIGTAGSYAQDDNQLKFKGYVLLNPFVSYKFTKALMMSVNANNVTNSLGITEAEENAITPNTTNIIRARSVTGRTIAATIAYQF